jgi:hypothetical protein
VLEDLAGAEVVFVAADDDGLRLAVLQYLFDRGHLHAIGLETFPRTAQPSLDDFSFQRIDEAELEKRCGAIAGPDRPVLAFARERRLPVLGLGVEAQIRDAVATGGLGALSEEARRALPATKPDAAAGEPGLVSGLDMDVAADVAVEWYRVTAPEGAQIAILSACDRAARRLRIAPRDGLPERLFARSGRTYRTLVAVAGSADAAEGAVFSKSYADYVWFTGES